MKRTGSAAKSSKSNGSSTRAKPNSRAPRVAVALCLRTDRDSELVPRKLYRLLNDGSAAAEGYLRVVDDSGEDYLYPADYFAVVNVPVAVAKALALVA